MNPMNMFKKEEDEDDKPSAIVPSLSNVVKTAKVVTLMNYKDLTPLVLAFIGGAVTIIALLAPGVSDTKFSTVAGIAGSAITGAAGLAQVKGKKDD